MLIASAIAFSSNITDITVNLQKNVIQHFQYNSGDLVYIILPVMSQLHTASRKVMIKYVRPGKIYKTIDPHNYLLMTLDGKILRGL